MIPDDDFDAPDNTVLQDILERIDTTSKQPFEISLMWAVSAKNTMENVHGFSPNQLVFGENISFNLNAGKPELVEKYSELSLVVDIWKKFLQHCENGFSRFKIK